MSKQEYGNGLLKDTEQMIYFVQREIDDIKKSEFKPNSNRQITNGGKLLAYNKMLSKLKSTKDKILSKKKKEPETISDGFGNTWSAFCLTCKKKTMQIVRPGKVQCSRCG